MLVGLRLTGLSYFGNSGLWASRWYSFLTLQSSELVYLWTREEIDGLNYSLRSTTQNYFGSSCCQYISPPTITILAKCRGSELSVEVYIQRFLGLSKWTTNIFLETPTWGSFRLLIRTDLQSARSSSAWPLEWTT